MSSFNGTISSLMNTFITNPPQDPVRQAQEEIAGVKAIMVQNVEQILSRGERIELLVDKTDHMSTQAKAFRKRSQALRRKMWWKNQKLLALSGFIVLVSLLGRSGMRSRLKIRSRSCFSFSSSRCDRKAARLDSDAVGPPCSILFRSCCYGVYRSLERFDRWEANDRVYTWQTRLYTSFRRGPSPFPSPAQSSFRLCRSVFLPCSPSHPSARSRAATVPPQALRPG